MKSPQRKLRIAGFAVLILFALLVLPILRFRREVNLNPLPSRFVRGVYHVHSTYSDGSGEPEDICAAAQESGLDFLILTDHGEPNLRSLNATAWHGKTLLVGGTECSLVSGHLAAFGWNDSTRPLPPEADAAIADIRRLGGASFIAHPFAERIPWTDWHSAGKATGIEVLSLYSQARRSSFFTMLTLAGRYLFNPEFALLQILKYPERNMAQWDRMTRAGHHMAGIFALDAHGSLPLWGKTRLPLPSYRAMFALMTIYVRIPRELTRNARESAGILARSIRRGHFFNVVEGIGPANGFDALYFPQGSTVPVEMGDAHPGHRGTLRIHLPFTFETRVRLIRNGSEVFDRDSRLHHTMDVDIRSAGVYRLEIRVPGNRFSRIPWIVTNPFYIGVAGAEAGDTPYAAPREETALRELDFKAEHDSASSCRVAVGTGDPAMLMLEYRLAPPDSGPDSWCAAALRRNLDFSRWSEIRFQARASKQGRFWMDLRSGAGDSPDWFRRSFRATPEWGEVVIPFRNMNRYNGDGHLDLSRIRALFFSVTNRLEYPPVNGRLEIRRIRLTTVDQSPPEAATSR